MRRWDPRRPGGCRAPGKRAPGGPVHRGAAHAGTGTDRRRAGPDGAHHQARQGEPGLRSARTRRDSRRRPVRTGAGWSTSPTCRPGTGFLVAPPSSRGLCATAASSAGPPAAARGTDFVLGAPGQAIRAAQAPRRRRPRGPGPPQRPRIQVTCPSPTPGDSSTRAPVASAGAVGSSLRRHRRPGPGQVLQARGPFWRDGPWKGRDDPLKPQPPAG